jgi:hypothetical protein
MCVYYIKAHTESKYNIIKIIIITVCIIIFYRRHRRAAPKLHFTTAPIGLYRFDVKNYRTATAAVDRRARPVLHTKCMPTTHVCHSAVR